MELYKILKKVIPDYSGEKICLALSSGLDARIVGGFLAQKRKIDLAYSHFFLEENREIVYTERIANALSAEFYPIFLPDYQIEKDEITLSLKNDVELASNLLRSGCYTALRILEEKLNLKGDTLKNYVILFPYGLDVLTGIKVNPLTLFTYKKHDREYILKKHYQNQDVLYKIIAKFGKRADNPIWHSTLIEYCLNMPLQKRFHQYEYRKMLKQYFPGLAKIPREGMHISMDCGEVKYFHGRIKYWWRKHAK